MDGIICRNLSKTYRQGEISVQALSDVDLTIERGEFVSLFGPSGSGKTTLLNLLGGLDEPTSGRIDLYGMRVDQMSAAERADLRLHHIGFVFQAYNLVPVLSAVENVEFVLQLQGQPARERRERARRMLADVGLDGLESRRPHELSGGQQQRVAVARALAAGPKLVLADEPTANLDSKTAVNLLELMLSMNRTAGVTFVFSTHDKTVMDYAQRLVGLRDGRIVSDDRR